MLFKKEAVQNVLCQTYKNAVGGSKGRTMDPMGESDGFVIMDRLGQVVSASARFAALSGRPSKDLVGQSFFSLFDPCQQVSISSAIQTLKAWERFERAATIERSDRGKVPVHLLMHRVKAGGCCAVVNAAPGRAKRMLPHPAPDRQDLSHLVLVAQESERKRIAADLHDGLGQLLSAAKFGVESALAGTNEQARTTLVDVASTVKQALDEVRRIAMNLRPSTLDDLGILATLSWFLREFRSIYRSIEVEASFPHEEREVPDALKVAIFRVVQEAMGNIAKHSRATRARVRLEGCGGELRLAIEDNGIGFDSHEVASRTGIDRRLGHSCARERVESAGGTFTLWTAPGAGVRIEISWPLTVQQPRADHVENLADRDRRGPHPAAQRVAGASGARSGPPGRW
jgi:signal transduction histidine kinase